MVEKKQTEEQHEIQIIPTQVEYQVMVDGEQIRVKDVETALILAKLERIEKKLEEK